MKSIIISFYFFYSYYINALRSIFRCSSISWMLYFTTDVSQEALIYVFCVWLKARDKGVLSTLSSLFWHYRSWALYINCFINFFLSFSFLPVLKRKNLHSLFNFLACNQPHSVFRSFVHACLIFISGSLDFHLVT